MQIGTHSSDLNLIREANGGDMHSYLLSKVSLVLSFISHLVLMGVGTTVEICLHSLNAANGIIAFGLL